MQFVLSSQSDISLAVVSTVGKGYVVAEYCLCV